MIVLVGFRPGGRVADDLAVQMPPDVEARFLGIRAVGRRAARAAGECVGEVGDRVNMAIGAHNGRAIRGAGHWPTSGD